VKQKSATLENQTKFLFIGGLSQRKGISYLFEAVEGLEDKVALTVVGKKAVSDCNALNLALEQHRWIPSLSHDEVLSLMREHDVFIFPSLFLKVWFGDYRGHVARSSVITTDRTAGPDIIKDGVMVGLLRQLLP
jgi:glycosyltransferase involved in cell wall biosynthesis